MILGLLSNLEEVKSSLDPLNPPLNLVFYLSLHNSSGCMNHYCIDVDHNLILLNLIVGDIMTPTLFALVNNCMK